MQRIRQATKKELDTEVETIKYSLIERYCKMIETKNLNRKCTSVSFGSMHLPHGIIVSTYANEDLVDIHKEWRKIIWDVYFLDKGSIYEEAS